MKDRKEYYKEYWKNPINRKRQNEFAKKRLHLLRQTPEFKEKEKQYKLAYTLKNKELLKEKMKIYCANPIVKEKKKISQKMFQLKKYNLTLEEFQALKDNQNNLCAICGKPKSLVVDHNHETGKVRGLICSKCNLMIGHCYEDITILQNAINYLQINSI